MLKLHLGKTKHQGWLRFFRGTITAKGFAPQHCYFQHPIKSMFGISGSGARWFFGVIQVDGTRDVRSSETAQSD